MNVYQSWTNRKLFFLARSMRKNKIFDQVYVNHQGFTVVRRTGEKQRKTIKNRGDLHTVSGVDIAEYERSHN